MFLGLLRALQLQRPAAGLEPLALGEPGDHGRRPAGAAAAPGEAQRPAARVPRGPGAPGGDERLLGDARGASTARDHSIRSRSYCLIVLKKRYAQQH